MSVSLSVLSLKCEVCGVSYVSWIQYTCGVYGIIGEGHRRRSSEMYVRSLLGVFFLVHSEHGAGAVPLPTQFAVMLGVTV